VSDDLDALPWADGASGPTRNGATGRRAKSEPTPEHSRRGKTARNRGNAYEREVAAILGGRRVGQYGDKVDVDVPGWIRVQCKNGASYPERLDGWLRAIPVQADMLRALVIGDAPGPGRRRRSLIVLDLEEFASWYASPTSRSAAESVPLARPSSGAPDLPGGGAPASPGPSIVPRAGRGQPEDTT